MVEERSPCDEAKQAMFRGARGSENAGLSNDKTGGNPVRRKSEVSWGRFVRPGIVGTLSRGRMA